MTCTKQQQKLCAQIHIMPTDFMCVTTILLVQLIHGTCINYYVLQEYKKLGKTIPEVWQ